jgi:hypothetical protein
LGQFYQPKELNHAGVHSYPYSGHRSVSCIRTIINCYKRHRAICGSSQALEEILALAYNKLSGMDRLSNPFLVSI